MINNFGGKKINSLLALAVLLTVGLSNVSPSIAAFLSFRLCGNFINGGSVDGVIKFDTESFDLIEALITTTDADGMEIQYTELDNINLSNDSELDESKLLDFLDISNLADFDNGFLNFEEQFIWGFQNKSNKFIAVMPLEYIEDSGGSYDTSNYEKRVEFTAWGKDPDKVQAVPEPLTTAGVGVGLAIGAIMKKKRRSN